MRDLEPRDVLPAVVTGLTLLVATALLAVCTSGCASAPCPPCVPITEVHEVPIEHAVNLCAGMEIPPEPAAPPALPESATAEERATWVAEYVAVWKAWAKELQADLLACTEEVPQ